MKRRLAITTGILVFLTVLALYGYLRLGQQPQTVGRARATAVGAERPPAAPPSTGAVPSLPAAPDLEKRAREQLLEAEEREKARQQSELSALMRSRQENGNASGDSSSTQQSDAAMPPAPPPALKPAASPPLTAAEQLDKSIFDRKSGTGATAPAPTPSRSSANSLEQVDATLKKLDWGQMAFDVPEKLRLEQTALIHLLISPAQTAEQLTAAIRAQTNEPVKIESARIQISGMMEAKLVGSAFDIHPITPDEPQMVSRTEPTEWKWEIRPRQSGQQSLHLTLNAIIRFDDKERPRVVRTFDRVIQVEVAATGSYAPWLLPGAAIAAGLILLGALAALYRLSQRRKRVAPSSPGAPTSTSGHSDAVDLFLSYSRRDEKRVLPIADRLRSAGLNVWMDQSGIDGATLWAQEISDAIRRAKVCVLFGSASSYGSPHVIREVSLACEERKPILPLQLDSVETPSAMRYQLAGIQHIALYQGDPEANFQLILRALARLGAQPSNAAAPG